MKRTGKITTGLSEADREAITLQALASIAKMERYEEQATIIPDRIAAIFQTNDIPYRATLCPSRNSEGNPNSYAPRKRLSKLKSPKVQIMKEIKEIVEDEHGPNARRISPVVLNLHNAIMDHRLGEIKEIIRNNPPSVLLDTDYFGHTALGFAYKYGTTEIIRLIKRTINTAYQDKIYA